MISSAASEEVVVEDTLKGDQVFYMDFISHSYP